MFLDFLLRLKDDIILLTKLILLIEYGNKKQKFKQKKQHNKVKK